MAPQPTGTILARLPGTVIAQSVRCGKPNYKCVHGESQDPYWYRFWRDDGYQLRKEYVRRADLQAGRTACAAYQAELRALWQLRPGSNPPGAVPDLSPATFLDQVMRWFQR